MYGYRYTYIYIKNNINTNANTNINMSGNNDLSILNNTSVHFISTSRYLRIIICTHTIIDRTCNL